MARAVFDARIRAAACAVCGAARAGQRPYLYGAHAGVAAAPLCRRCYYDRSRRVVARGPAPRPPRHQVAELARHLPVRTIVALALEGAWPA